VAVIWTQKPTKDRVLITMSISSLIGLNGKVPPTPNFMAKPLWNRATHSLPLLQTD